MCNAVLDYFNNEFVPFDANHTHIALIPKVNNPISFNDYGPIIVFVMFFIKLFQRFLQLG